MKKNLLLYSPIMFGMSLTVCNANSTSTKQPNILLINIDDLGWTDLSCNGSKYYETPNIDRLKEAGIWFSQAYAGASNSAPSRACMLTGLNTPRHGIYTVGTSERGKSENRKLIPIPNNEILPDGIQILPKILHDAGYQTFHVGKWHVTEDPIPSGFDVNIGGNHSGHPKKYFSPYKNPNLADGKDGEYLCDRLGNEASELIKNADPDKPFFLYYATYAVHTPLQAKPELISKYEQKESDNNHHNPKYAALVQSMDENIGKVLKALKESGREENTLIIFTTDNGGSFDISKQRPLRAGKGSFYEGGIRVPFIVYQKGVFEKDEISDVAISQMDIFPTLMEYAGIESDGLIFDGKSLVSLLENKKDKELNERPLFWHFPAYLERGNSDTKDKYFRTRPVSVVRKGDWKLIENYETNDYELYNLSEDLSEKHDLASSNKEKVNELSSILNNWKKEVNAPIPTKINPEYKGEK